MSLPRYRDFERAAKLKRAIYIGTVILLVLVVSLVCYLVPLSSRVAADEIAPRAEGEMRVHFLDVGQGDCTVLEFPDGDVLIVDAGDGSFETEHKIISYIKGLHASSYSILATHADYDHYGGFAEIIRTFGAETAYLPQTGTNLAGYRRFLAAAESSGCKFKTLSRYLTVTRPSGAYAVCISPRSDAESNDNDASAVLFVSYGGVNILLGGDISASQENTLLAEYNLLEGIFDSGDCRVRLEDTDILKVSHHGSANSTSEKWLSLISPSTAVFSCGRGNGYSHPAAESVARLTEIGADIYRTDELGNIVVSIKDNGYTVNYGLE